jgi:hypothetical protein
MMYIQKISLRDVRCFQNVEIDLSDAKPGTSILIAGNNGIGKSAILRAIAMGLCDRDSSASLLRELEGAFIRDGARIGAGGETKAEIKIALAGSSKRVWEIKTSVREWNNQIIERVRQEYKVDGKRYGRGKLSEDEHFRRFSSFWSDLFVVGYGAGLRTTSTAKYTDYFAPDALYPLFKYDTPLQDPELAWHRLLAAEQSASKNRRKRSEVDKTVRDLLRYVLDLDDEADISLEPDGIFVTENDERKVLDELGDGHRALVKITLDILVWYLLRLNYSENKGEGRRWRPLPLDKGRPRISGIVIIDEIEQHLHPKLQRQIIKRLNEKFPKVQFIITTHSPLCVSGTADIDNEKQPGYRIFSLSKTGGAVGIERRPIPQGLTADQILVDYFKLPTTLNVSLQQDYIRVRNLLLKAKRTPVEEREFKRLTKKLSKISPVLGETLQERQLFLGVQETTNQIARYLKVRKK